MTQTYYRIDLRFAPPTPPSARLRRPNRASRIIVPIFFLALMIGLSMVIMLSRATAEVVLVPRTCLGGWHDAPNAAGLPQVTSGDESAFSTDNSAHIADTLADLYCGDFAGDIPESTSPTGLTVTFSWAFKKPSESPVVPVTPEDLASSTSAALDAPATSVGVDATSTPSQPEPPKEESTPTQTPPTSEPALESAPEPSAPQETPPPADPVPTPASPQSFLFDRMRGLFAHVAYAQEMTSLEATTTATSTPLEPSDDAVLEISYTLDGQTWNVLGAIKQTQFNQISYTIPTDHINQWGDLAHLQIRIRTLSSVSDNSTIYVDGMTVTASYIPVSAPQESHERLSLLFNAISSGGALHADAIFDGANTDQTLIVHDTPGATLHFYKFDDPTFSMTIGAGDDGASIPASLLGEGSFAVFDVPTDCATNGPEACKLMAGAKLFFSVAQGTTTP